MNVFKGKPLKPLICSKSHDDSRKSNIVNMVKMFMLTNSQSYITCSIRILNLLNVRTLSDKHVLISDRKMFSETSQRY